MSKSSESPDQKLEDLLSSIDRLREAKTLLDEIWSQNNGYNTNFSQETLFKIQKFYNYDDSE
jgi:hypothetical protein